MRNNTYRSGKTYTHNIGLSCCFRQWRAESHCAFMHGYALQVEFEFEREYGDLNAENWVQDFGGLKQVKAWLEKTFDHRTLVAKDDPEYERFKELNQVAIIDMVTVEHVGCEAFAKMIYDSCQPLVDANIVKVTVREHAGNWASYGRND